MAYYGLLSNLYCISYYATFPNYCSTLLASLTKSYFPFLSFLATNKVFNTNLD